MGIDDVIGQGKQFFEENKDKIAGALKTDKAEEISDGALDAAADFVKKVAPESAHGHVDGVRDSIDKSIGHD